MNNENREKDNIDMIKKNNSKIFISTILIIILILVNICTKAQNVNDRFYFDKNKIEAKAGDEITINLNIYSNDMVSCSAVVEYSKELTLEQISYDIAKLSENAICKFIPQQTNNDDKQKENLLGNKKRIVFLQARMEDSQGNKNIFKGDMHIAELKLKIPDNAKKGTTYFINWVDNPDLTYIGTSKYKDSILDEFKNCEILITESKNVESDSIQQIISNGEDNKDETITNGQEEANGEEEVANEQEEETNGRNEDSLIRIEDKKYNDRTSTNILPKTGDSSRVLIGIFIVIILIILIYRKNKSIQTK